MAMIRSALTALAAVLTLTAAPASAQTEAERQAIVEQGRAEHQQRLSGLRSEMEAAVSALREAPACVEDAAAIEAMALTGKGHLVGPAIESLLAPRCDPGETSDWTLVQHAHFVFTHMLPSAGAGGASGTALSVRFPSLVSCFRAGLDVRKHLSHPYEARAACVDARTGTLVLVE